MSFMDGPLVLSSMAYGKKLLKWTSHLGSDISSPLFLLATSHPLSDLGSSRPHLPAQPLNLGGTQGVASGYTGAGHTSSGGYAAAGFSPVTSTPKVQLLIDVQWLLFVT